MLAVSQAELAAIQQEAVSAACDKTAAIYRDLTEGTPDAYGSSSSSKSDTSAYTLMYSGVPAGMSEPTGGELQNFDFTIGDKIAWKLHMPVGTGLQERDHVVIESQVLEVHVILTPRSYPALLAAICAEVK